MKIAANEPARGWTAIGLAAVALLVVDCAADVGQSPESASETNSELVNGTTTSLRPEIGQYFSGKTNKFCGATLIAPDFVLTAAHCMDPGITDTTVSGDSFFFTDATGVDQGGFPVDAMYSFAGKDWEYTVGGQATTDVALLHLQSGISTSLAMPASIAVDSPLSGKTVTTFGFGCTDRNNTNTGGFKQFFTFSFGSATTALCAGDSGGPAVYGSATSNGTIWGTNKGTTGTNQTDVFGDVSYLRTQIENIMYTTDYPGINGSDLAGLDSSSFSASSVLSCASSCATDVNCKAFAYVASSSTCYSKKGVPVRTGATSDVSSGLAGYLELFMDRPGHDYSHFQTTPDNWESCAVACATDSRCVTYTYYNPSNSGTCYLKDGIPGAVRNSSCLSGEPKAKQRWIGVDIPGGDYSNFGTSGVDDCQNHCAQDHLCRGWAFRASDNHCWLKNRIGSRTNSSGITSAERRGLEMNVDRPGSDIKSSNLSAPEPEACQALCAQNSSCKAWTFVKATSSRSPRCYLKNAVPNAVFNRNTISGLKGLEFGHHL